MKWLVVIALVMAATVAQAESPGHGRMDRIRELYKKGDYEGVRRELLEAYDAKPEPALLFALGQVELNLGNYQAAISYYERFLATSPADDQVALAQQAIGAARIRLTDPEPEPPPPTPLQPIVEPLPEAPEQPPSPAPKRWTVTHTGFVAFGGAAALLGLGLLYYSHQLGGDRSGTLSDYDSRLDQARTTRLTGAGIAIAGTLIIGVTVVW